MHDISAKIENFFGQLLQFTTRKLPNLLVYKLEQNNLMQFTLIITNRVVWDLCTRNLKFKLIHNFSISYKCWVRHKEAFL